MARDECCPALLARQDAGVDQRADTGAHRVNCDTEAFREFGFGRQLFARSPLAVRETRSIVALDLLVQRLRRGRKVSADLIPPSRMAYGPGKNDLAEV